jgi:hypothetical protein
MTGLWLERLRRIKQIIHNVSHVIQKSLSPGGIRTQVFCQLGGCDVHCATPPRQGNRLKLYVSAKHFHIKLLGPTATYIYT